MVLVIVATLAVGEAAVYCGAGPVLVSAILPHMPEGNIAICAFFYVVAYAGNLLLTPLGIVAGFGGTLMDLAGAMGLSPVGISYIFLFSLHQCILPYELTTNIMAYGFGMMNMKQFLLYFGAKSLLALVFLLFVYLPWFTLMGIM